MIRHLQRHEFETLVLASLASLAELLDEPDLGGVRKLQQEIEGAAPEDVNDGEESAPSKRLARHVRGYVKPFHGPLAVERAGLALLRNRCPRFAAWVGTLESLATGNP